MKLGDARSWQVDDFADSLRPSIKRFPLLVEIEVTIIYPSHSSNDVTDHPFGDIGIDPESGEAGSSGAAQIVETPVGHAGEAIKSRLRFRKAGESRTGPSRENMRALISGAGPASPKSAEPRISESRRRAIRLASGLASQQVESHRGKAIRENPNLKPRGSVLAPGVSYSAG